MELNLSKTKLVIFITGLLTFKIFTSYPSFIYRDSASSAWIVVILSTVIMFVIWRILWSFCKNYSSGNFFELMKKSYGEKLYFIICLVLGIYMLLSLSIWMYNSVEIIKLSFYERSPVFFVLMFYIAISIYGAFLGMRPIITASTVIILFVFLSLICLFCGSAEYYDYYTNLFPVMGFGVKNTILQSLVYTNIFDDFIFLLFMISFENKKEDIYKVGNVVILLSGICITVFTIIYQLSMPYPMGGTYIFPYEELTRMSINNRFFVFFNFILIFIIISSFFVYISYKLYFISGLFSSILKPCVKNISYKKLVLPLGILLTAFSMAQQSILKNLMLLYINRIFILVFTFLFPLVTFLVARIRGVDMS